MKSEPGHCVRMIAAIASPPNINTKGDITCSCWRKLILSKTVLLMDASISEQCAEGFHGRTPIRKPLIKYVNRQKRVIFAKEHRLKPISFWNTVIFSDEIKINLYGSDGGFKIWREAGKALTPKNTIKTVKFGGGSALVWGCMSAGGVGELAFIDAIMDKHVYLGILKDNLEKSANKLGFGSGFMFQQDNDPNPTAKIVHLYLLYHCRKQLHTPAQSPDLNVIENLWSQLEKAVHEH
ncbi:transposable element Tc1 transposase [Trichonephila clavipes]|uniref:Transposable element Tc1 transposase n=1 Tax=Trichonephila clavipes TaxID=2585209 RepID=A0A8X6VVQ0_TRICX|nr:transposable element Tc1 transposase [Trichonephila clavipes]